MHSLLLLVAWRSSNVARRMNEVALRRARLVLGWLTISGITPRHMYVIPSQLTMSTQHWIVPGSRKRARPLIGWGKGENVTSAGWQVTLRDPTWHVNSRSGEASFELLYSVYLLTYFTVQEPDGSIQTLGHRITLGPNRKSWSYTVPVNE